MVGVGLNNFEQVLGPYQKYGAIFFNQFGREFPMGGMNEAGLVVELMWLDETVFPSPDDWKKILPAFESLRKPNADAIADLALNNFVEMRDLVADPHFLAKKKIEKLIAAAYPERFISPYQMVSFTHIPYAEALQKGNAIHAVTEQLLTIENLEAKMQTPEIRQLVEPVLFGG